MRVLALDTSTPYLVLGLPDAERAIKLDRRHAEELWGHLDAFLKETRTGLPDLEAIAVGQGPGSYTGLRIAVAAGLGLGRGLGIPVVGVDTLAGVALRYLGLVSVVHTSRKGLGYSASFKVDDGCKVVVQAKRVGLEGLETTIPYGLSGAPGLTVIDEPPSGRALARLGAVALSSGKRGVTPVYL